MAEAPQTFHCFKRLPPELQHHIWRCAIDAVPSRVVNPRAESNRILTRLSISGKETINYDLFLEDFGQYTSPCPIPSVLDACRDSRELASRRWRLTFASFCRLKLLYDHSLGRYRSLFIDYVTFGQHFPTQHADATLESCPKVFFDFDRDLLWLGKVEMPTFIQAVDTKDRHALRNIALDITEVWMPRRSLYKSSGGNMARHMHEDFPLLKQLGFFGVYGVSHDNPQLDPTFLDRHCDPEDASKTLVHLINPSPAAVEFYEGIYKDHYWAHFKYTLKRMGLENPKLRFMDSEMYERGSTDVLKEWNEYEVFSLQEGSCECHT